MQELTAVVRLKFSWNQHSTSILGSSLCYLANWMHFCLFCMEGMSLSVWPQGWEVALAPLAMSESALGVVISPLNGLMDQQVRMEVYFDVSNMTLL